jgi:hypothetical protein
MFNKIGKNTKLFKQILDIMRKEGMKKIIGLFLITSLFLTGLSNSQEKTQSKQRYIVYPELPRVSAYEAYTKYKAGKAFILHAGGEAYNRRHLLAGINMDFKDRDHLIERLPRVGVELFTYCY